MFKIQDRGWQNWLGKRIEATRSWKCAFKKCIEVLAATDGFATSCWHISTRYLQSRPVTCGHDPLLAATTPYLRPWPFNCGHDPLLAATSRYLRPRSVTCGHDSLLSGMEWSCLKSDPRPPLVQLSGSNTNSTQSTPEYTLLNKWRILVDVWGFCFTCCTVLLAGSAHRQNWAWCAALFCLLVVHTDRTGLGVLHCSACW
jgi:hypothetical protein